MEEEREEVRPTRVKRYPASRLFEFDTKDWNWLRQLVGNIEHPKWWLEALAVLLLGSLLSCIFNALGTNNPETAKVFWSAAVGLAIATIITGIFWVSDKRRFTVQKKEAKAFMKELEKAYGLEGLASPPLYVPTDEERKANDVSVEERIEINEWTAHYKMPVDNEVWGSDSLPIKIREGRSLTSIACKVIPSGSYWRVGIKLEEASAKNTLPYVLTDKSFLFHAYRNENGQTGIAAFDNRADGSDRVTNDMPLFDVSAEHSMSIDCDYYTNRIVCRFDQYEYTYEVKPELLKRVFLVAWWDGKGQPKDTVIFKDIEYVIE